MWRIKYKGPWEYNVPFIKFNSIHISPSFWPLEIGIRAGACSVDVHAATFHCGSWVAYTGIKSTTLASFINIVSQHVTITMVSKRETPAWRRYIRLLSSPASSPLCSSLYSRDCCCKQLPLGLAWQQSASAVSYFSYVVPWGFSAANMWEACRNLQGIRANLEM